MVRATSSIADASLARGDREALIELRGRYKAMGDEWIRKMVLQHHRTDVLAAAVLGYSVQPHHLAMMRWQHMHPRSLQLSWRGCGKTTTLTVTKAIHYILCNPNIRIVITSKSTSSAEAFLKEIKGHLERNERLAELFGVHYDARRCAKWDNREIEVATRRSNAKEGTITAVGVDGTIVARHYDVGLSDDLVDEDNSRTSHMRAKTRTWYRQTLDPCIEPPDPAVFGRGHHHHHGTRYHYADLWGDLMENDLKGHTQIIPALDSEGRSAWPEKFPATFLEEKRKWAGTIVYNAQFQCNTEAMKGEIIRYDDCQMVSDEEIPTNLRKFQGVDLAIGEASTNDRFAHVTIGLDPVTDNIYVLDYFEEQIRFSAQTQKILDEYERHDPVRCLVEAVGYQAALVQNVQDKRKGLRVFPAKQTEDKTTRAQKLSARFEQKKMFFRKGGKMHQLVEQCVLMPNVDHEDGFDALDLAVRAATERVKKKRAVEPGLF